MGTRGTRKAVAPIDTAKEVPQLTAHVVGVAKYDLHGGLFSAMSPRVSDEGKGVASRAGEFEDDFRGSYGIGQLTSGAAVIEPPYTITQLESFVDVNNALRPCIDAMITNVDGTGWVVETTEKNAKVKAKEKEVLAQGKLPANDDEVKKSDDMDMDDPVIRGLVDFFREPWPGMSFTTIRKKLRRDLHATGTAYLEVMENLTGEITFVRHIEAKTMRLISLDEGYWTDVKLMRGGKEVTVTTHVRRRRCVQRINQTDVYFKEFGAERDLNRKTGAWAKEGEVLDPQLKATQVIVFVLDKDVSTPYGVPRWISQLPSVLGSRKAEEYNLNYFDAGGVPPALILVQGGALAGDSKIALESYLNTDPKSKNRAVVVEIAGGSSGATISDTQKTDVKVHEFGGAQQKDMMFDAYDKRCEQLVRKSWRLPPLFVGLTDDYNFASAYASYVVAEAQVFKPERDEFDEIITLKLVRALTKSNQYAFRSLGLSVADVAEQMKFVESAKGKNAITFEEYIRKGNQLLGLDLEVNPQADEMAAAAMEAETATKKAGVPHPDLQKHALDAAALSNEEKKKQIEQIGKLPPLDPNKAAAKRAVAKGDHPASQQYVIAMAEDLHDLMRKGDYGIAYKKALEDIGMLDKAEALLFKSELSRLTFGTDVFASENTPELLQAAIGLIADSTVERV